MEPPTLNEWIEANPGQTLNDYYKAHPVRREASFSTKHEAINSASKTLTPSYRSLVTSSIVCGIGFIGYFCPWFSIPILRLSISGHELMQLFNFFAHIQNLENIQEYVKYLYLIPITYIITILGAAAKSYFLTALGTICNIIIIGITFKFILELPNQVLNSITFGLYLTIISIIGQLYNIFTMHFYKH